MYTFMFTFLKGISEKFVNRSILRMPYSEQYCVVSLANMTSAWKWVTTFLFNNETMKTGLVTVLRASDWWAFHHKWGISIMSPRPTRKKDRKTKKRGWRGVHGIQPSTCCTAIATPNTGEHRHKTGPSALPLAQRGTQRTHPFLRSYWLSHVDGCYRRECHLLGWYSHWGPSWEGGGKG